MTLNVSEITQGPWTRTDNKVFYESHFVAETFAYPDAEFIAAARTGWPEAVDELEAVKHREYWNDDLQEEAIRRLREILWMHDHKVEPTLGQWYAAQSAVNGLACSRLHVPDQGK